MEDKTFKNSISNWLEELGIFKNLVIEVLEDKEKIDFQKKVLGFLLSICKTPKIKLQNLYFS